MEKYIRNSIISIINQSFQNFEIIVVNDNSNDNTNKILEELQSGFNRIKIINHNKNLGVYKSRIDAVFNSKGKYIFYIDPDDMLLNQNLFEELYSYNLKYNLDMIEFSVYYKDEGKRKIYIPKSHMLNHYHNYNQQIISQPELSNLIFFIPNTFKYTYIYCRTIWNKIVKKNILLKSIKYIEKLFHNLYLIAADDTPINILNFNYANNYSNVNIPGYLYNVRKIGMSRLQNNKKHDIIVSYNYLLYLKILYKYIIDYKKNLNFFFYDFKLCHSFLYKLKDLNSKYKKIALDFFNEIYTFQKKNKKFSIYYNNSVINYKISNDFKKLLKKLIIYFTT